MKLSNVAIFFNKDPVYDGYTSAFLFNAQLPPPITTSSGDGASYHHRSLYVDPTKTLPTRQVLQIYGDRWLVGYATPDGFLGVQMRRHYTMKLATHLVHVLTPGQAVANAAGVSAYTQLVFFKDMPNTLTTAELDSFWNAFFALGEPVVKGTFLRDENGVLYRTRNEYIPSEGLRIAQVDQLDAGSLVSAIFDTGTFDPVQDKRTTGTTTVGAIFMEMPKFYVFTHVSDPGAQPGDYAVFVPNSLTVTSGQTFTVAGVKWKVLAFNPELDAIAIHARRA